MKLILKDYLRSLKERDELDALLPNLVSEMGLNVLGTPRRGCKEYGVDFAAVGCLTNSNDCRGEKEKIYLFSLKQGDLDRKTWDDASAQSLRRSLNEIKDVYIAQRIPKEHSEKPVVICLCFGGEISPSIQDNVRGYIKNETKENLSFEEWNGDKIAYYIQQYFMHEKIAPEELQSDFRRSLAMVDNPETSFYYFNKIVNLLTVEKECEKDKKIDKEILSSIRQLYVYLWILYVWGRKENNIESAYLCSEIIVLYIWDRIKGYFDKENATEKSIQKIFNSILELYFKINEEYLDEKIIPYTKKLFCLSFAVNSTCDVDINLKLFNILGRLGTAGLWLLWRLKKAEAGEYKQNLVKQKQTYQEAMKQLILNNPILLSPYKDDQAIEISLALQFLVSTNQNNRQFIKMWLSEMLLTIDWVLNKHDKYPLVTTEYMDLLKHPLYKTEEYRKSCTKTSILYPYLFIFAAILEFDDICNFLKDLRKKIFSHSTFQLFLWGSDSEACFYRNNKEHGIAFIDLNLNKDIKGLLQELKNECDHSYYFENMSLVQKNFIPILLTGCRHYRRPIPLQYLLKIEVQ